MSRRRKTPRPSLLVALAAGTVIAIASLSACAGSSGDSDDVGAGGGSAAAEAPADAAADESESTPAGDAAGTDFSTGGGGPDEGVSPVLLQQADIIKTGAIELESDDVGKVVDTIKGLVLTSGGRISSEDTTTDARGHEVRSHLEIQVPVARFDAVYEEIPSYAKLVDTQQSEKDVTAQVADIDSRVRSAQDSIDQLRTLFSEATKLGDVIALERELSQRQADLEALQAQQRSLQAQTTMSTILVGITDPVPVAATIPDDQDQAGFVSGIKAGWDGLVTFVIGLGHFVGLVLPIGTLLAVVALCGWLAVRKVMPRRSPPGQPQPSE